MPSPLTPPVSGVAPAPTDRTDRDRNIRRRQRGCIVHAVPDHAHAPPRIPALPLTT